MESFDKKTDVAESVILAGGEKVHLLNTPITKVECVAPRDQYRVVRFEYPSPSSTTPDSERERIFLLFDTSNKESAIAYAKEVDEGPYKQYQVIDDKGSRYIAAAVL